MPEEFSVIAVWKEPSVLGEEPNGKPRSVVTIKSSENDREAFVYCAHWTRLAKE